VSAAAGAAIAVVIVSYRSADALPATLAALVPQLEPGDELVVVDNAPGDGTADVVRGAWRGARLLEPGENLGFAGGCALGVRESAAPLVLLLNPDAVPAPGCLAALRACATAEPAWGAWQALVTLPGGASVNTAGNPVHFTGIAWAGGHDRPVAELGDGRRVVGSGSGAALCVRREAWDAVGGFDERYFMYGEDVDLSLRLRLAGWEVGLEPAARVAHDYAFVKGDYKWFLLERNRWWTLLRVYPAPLLWLLAPALLALELLLLPVAARGGWLRAKLRAQGAVLRALPALLARRRSVQATARVSPAAFAAGLSASLDSPFLGTAARLPGIAGAQAAYWRAVRSGLGRGSAR
jgi:GT2 family glycosyltransferase